MSTVLFVMKYPLHCHENLQVKFDGQMAAVRALGHRALCIGWNPQGMWLVEGEKRRFLRKNAFVPLPGYDHTKIFLDLMGAVEAALELERVDLLYLRYMPTFWNGPRALGKLKALGGKLVVEFPTYPRELENRRSLLRRPVFAYADHVLAKVNPLVDLYTVIGESCGDSLEGRPALNIENGIDVGSVPLHKPRDGEKDISLLGLASMTQAHGYDRVLEAMAAYQGEEKIWLHLVGGEGDGSLGAWRQLAERLGLGERVCFHGALYGDDLNKVVEECDVGLGPLSMFRLGLHRGTALKLREYMARGLPFVYAAQDAAIENNPRFCLQVPHDETPLDMEAMAAFAMRAKGDREAPMAMRAYAQAHMSWERVLKPVLERVDL